MSRKRVFLIAASAMALLLVLGMGTFLHGQEEYVPPNQVSQMDVERSQVFVTGAGYQLDKQQEKVHQQQEKAREQKQEEKKEDPHRIAAGNTPTPQKIRNDDAKEKNSNNNSNRSKKDDSSAEEDDSDPTEATESEEDEAKKPTISISVSSGQRVNGTRLDFSVTVTDYKGRNVPVFSESDGSFTVVCNGTALSSIGVDGTATWFRTDLYDGDNTIIVTAVDKEGNSKKKKVTFRGNTSAQSEVVGSVYVRIEAPILNLGVIHETQIEIISGDSAKDVLEKAFEEAGITPGFRSGYLSGISRDGIAAGAWVSDDTRALMEERRQTEKDPADQDPNQLKEHDFYDSSGWIYSVNGDFPSKGLGSYKMEDGDELVLVFQLADDVY